MQSDTLSFLTAGDAGVSWGLVAATGSLLRVIPFGQRFSITVIDGGFPKIIKARLSGAVSRMHGGNGTLHFVPFQWPKNYHVPKLSGSLLTYARFFAPQYFEKGHCLYFDTDMVFFESPVSLIDAARAEPDVPLWAVRNYPEDSFEKMIRPQAPEFGHGEYKNPEPTDTQNSETASPELYFNNGLLLINLDAWRSLNIASVCLSLAERYQFRWHDQDALNCVMRGRWRELPSRWNWQLLSRCQIPAGCALAHYSGTSKPWHFGYPAAAGTPFREALAVAGWSRWRPPFNFSQWLRHTRMRPWIAHAHYNLRESVGLPGIRRR